jgi:hypothetical protein
MTTNTGGPAFPLKEANAWDNYGMTLRDYFAAKAMQTVLSSSSGHHKNIAELAYQLADAMLKARG